MEIEIQQLPAMRLACIRHTGPYWQIGTAFDALGAWARDHGLPDKLRVAMYYDDPGSTPESELRSDAGFILPEEYAKVADGATLVEVSGGTYAVARHTGHYQGLSQAWGRFHEAFHAGGYRMALRPSLEIYRNDCTDVSADQLITDMCIPVEA
jgi:AraC family transcriptional regulator